jgi:hypothetical protein
MAWMSIQAPGSSVTAPCANCAHTDCAESRRMAAETCVRCDKVIGFDAKFVEARSGGLAHFVCEIKASAATTGSVPR